MVCADDAALEAFVAGQLDTAARGAVEAALDACAHCRGRLGALARAAEGKPVISIPDTLTPEMFEAGPDPHVGAVLGGRYRVLRVIGSGGMGAVYEAEHELIGRRVAVKLLHPELAARREVLQRFRNEARAAGAIGHPGIVRALDIGRTEGGAPFLVLELLDGRDLETELAARGPLPVAEAIDVAVAIADAVAAAHALEIVHRDLKPANVFLTDAGEVKVLDFGISKVRGALQTSPDTRSGVLLGTPAYMAPEQLGDGAAADARSDVYALGAILYRCLTGRLPHTASNLPALLAAILEGSVAPIERPDVKPALDLLVRRALDPDPDARPQTMGELRDALRSHAATTRRTTARPLGDAERRVAVAVVAIGGEPARLEARATAAGAKVVPGERGRFVFGDGTWSGDLVDRAGLCALALADEAARVAVGPAVLSGGEVELSEELAEMLAHDAPGAWIAPSLAHARLTEIGCELEGGRARIRRGRVAPALPLLGRRAELAQLTEAADDVLDERAPAVALVDGAPGVGKSRLLDALAEALRDEWRVLRGRTRERDADHAVIRALLRDFAGVDDRAGAAIAEAAVHALAVAACGEEGGARHLPTLRVLFGLAPASGDARLTTDRARVAALDVIEGLARLRPLALLIDDAQWADGPSLDVLGALAASRAPILIALAGRQAPDAPWLEGAEITRVRPRALKRGETRRLLGAIVGEARADAIAERIHAHTGGNPLFVEQLGRAVGAQDGDLPLPPSIEGAVQARLDELAPGLREAVKRGALFGVPFTAADLAALEVEAAREDLDDLVARGLLSASGVEGEERVYALATPLYADVARRMLGDEARRELHRRAAERLEGRVPREEIARHLELGGRTKDAARVYGEACLEAKRAGDLARTLRAGERALALGLGSALDVRIAVAEVLEVRGRLGEQEALLAAAERECEGPTRARVRTDRAVALQRLGQSGEALPLLEKALEDAEGDAEALARALGKHAVALTYAGETERAAEQLRAAERLVLTRASGLRADAAIWRGQLASMIGDLGAARNAYWAAVELYRELGDPRRAAEASLNLADLYNRVGAHDEAVPALEAGLADCRRVGASRLMEGYGLANLGYALAKEGRDAEAARALEEATEIAEEVGESRLAIATHVYRSRLAAARGRLEEARAGAEAAAERAAQLGFDSLEALARLALAEHAFAAGDAAAALRHARRALALSDALGGMEEDGGALFRVLGDAFEATGRADDAARARARGRASVESAAARIGDRHWRERFLHDVEAHRALLGDRS
ncbi:MAG: protein kinase [Myxococcota bacterium]|nr:protein kinase [Myxococcota bacterium]